MSRSIGLSAIVAGILFGIQGSSRAGLTTILDQIGPNASYVQGQNANLSQVLGAPNNSYNSTVIDNFAITTAGTTLTEVDAAVLGFAGFATGDFKNITAVHVEIYSSIAAAANSLTGDVANINVAAADINATTPYGTDQFSALAKLSVNVTLGVGTYYIAAIPVLNYNNTGAEIGIYNSTFGGDSNAVAVNPGGGFGYAGNINPLNSNAAYRIIGSVPSVVPEPSSLLMLSAGLGLAGFRLRRARASRA